MTLEERFSAFDRANPHVWEWFVRLTRRIIQAGHAHYSSDGVMHAIRWHLDIQTRREDGFKINNVYSPYYARKFMRENPDHDGFFRIRRVKSDQSITGSTPRHDLAVNA